MIPRSALVCFTLLTSGCIDGNRRVQTGDEVNDQWEQEQYATTNPYGDGSEGTAYYGSPGPSTQPEPTRYAADPAPARVPAAPRPVD